MADTKPTPELKEIATARRDITFPVFGGRLYNRDDTLINRGGGNGLKIYDDIERDAHAYGILQKRKLAVTARQWEVTAASDSALDKSAADICTAQLTALNFDKLTVEMLDAILKGYSVGEVMWAAVGNQIVAKKFIARNQRRFIFSPEYELRMLTLQNMLDGEALPPRKFITHNFGGKDGTPYGLGLGTRLFWPLWFKRQDITFWLTFADKFGSPTAVGKYPSGTGLPEQRTLLNALAALAQDTGVIIPEGMLIELLEAKRAGSTDAYEKLAKYMDDQMSEAVLGETMSTNSRSSGLNQGGQAQVHNEVRLELVRADADLLSGTLNETLLTWITEFNVPGAMPPTIRRIVEEPQDLTSQAARDTSIFQMGYKPTLKYIVDTYGGDWTEIPTAPAPVNPFASRDPLTAAFAEATAAVFPGQAAIDNAGDALPDAKLQAQMVKMLTPVFELVKSGATYTAIMGKLAETFPQMNTADLEELLARAIFVSDLWGRVNADAGTD